MNEDCLINDPRKSNHDCRDCDVCDGHCGKPCYSGSYLEFLMLLVEENEIESMHEDPAALAAEMEQQEEYYDKCIEDEYQDYIYEKYKNRDIDEYAVQSFQ